MPGSPEGAPRPAPEQLPPEEEQSPDLSPEAQAEAEADQENRKVDVEILGKSFGVRRKIDQGVTQTISGMHERIAKFKNALSTPKSLYLENRYLSAKDKYDRAQQKADNSRFRLTKRYHTNVANKRRAKMNSKEAAFKSHTSKMQGRLDYAKGRREHHEGIHNNKLKMYIDRKVLAQSRKEIRKMKREMRDDGKGRVERARIVGNMTQEQRKRIGEVSLRLELANRARDDVSQEKSQVRYKQSTDKDRIVSDRNKMQSKLDARDGLARSASSYATEQGKIANRIASLEQKLSSGIDHEDADPNDPEDQGTVLTDEGRARIMLEIDQARAEHDQLQQRINETVDHISQTNRDIDSLQNGIASHETKVSVAEGKIAELDREISEHNNKVRALEEERRRIIKQETGVELGTSRTEQEPIAPSAPVTGTTPQPFPNPVVSSTSNVIDFQAAQARRAAAEQQTPPAPENRSNAA